MDQNQDHVTITLPSRTVFWHNDLAVSQRDLDTFKLSERLANKVLDPIRDWIAENCQHATSIYADGVWFCDGNEAVLFKLFWAGQVC